MLQLDNETDFMMFEPNERIRVMPLNTLELKLQQSNFWLGAFNENKLIGYISVECGAFQRIKHCGYIVIGVMKSAQGQGVGHKLLEEAIKWSDTHLITRLELTVEVENLCAISLYKKGGFQTEGIRHHSMLVNGQYRDEYYMTGMIKKRIIQRAVKELSPYFEGLQCKYISENTIGNPVVAYEFTWKAEDIKEYDPNKYKKIKQTKTNKRHIKIPEWVK